MLRCGCMEAEHVLCQRRCAKVDLHDQDAHASTTQSFARLKELAATDQLAVPPLTSTTLDALNPLRTVLVAASKNPTRTSQLLLELSTGCECGAQLEHAITTMHLRPRVKQASCTLCLMSPPQAQPASTVCSPECPSVQTANFDPAAAHAAPPKPAPPYETPLATATRTASPPQTCVSEKSE
jgi:hypothetical protein